MASREDPDLERRPADEAREGQERRKGQEGQSQGAQVDGRGEEGREGEPGAGNSRDSEHSADSESDSDSDSESDSEEEDDDDDDGRQGRELREMEEQIQANPVQYDLHIQYISRLRTSGDLEKLRDARERMSSLFPLTPELWLEWIQDESRLVSSLEDAHRVEELYERGVQDYLSVGLWSSYLDFVLTQEFEKSDKNKESHLIKCRLLFEKSLSFCGLHFTEGNTIWQKYLNFEIQNCLETDQKEQMEKIRNLYHRLISIPHTKIDSTLSEYYDWERKQGKMIDRDMELNEFVSLFPKHVQFSYSKAKNMSIAREDMEKKLASFQSLDEECLNVYLEYLGLERQTNEPSRIQYIYERILSLFPLRSEIWIDYVTYLDNFLKVHSVIKGVYFRALRNCPWVFNLWFRYLLALERSKANQQEIQMVFEQSLSSGMQNPDEYVEIFLVCIDGLRRQCEFGDIDDEAKMHLMNRMESIFELAREYYQNYFSQYFDSFFKIFWYYTVLETRIFQNYEKAKNVWQELIKNYGNKFVVWKKYIDFELNQNNTSNVRALYKLCYSKKFEDYESQELCNDWINFERERGRLEDYDYAIAKVSKRLEELNQFQQKSMTEVHSTKSEQNIQTSFEPHLSGTSSTVEAKEKKRKQNIVNPKSNKKAKNHPPFGDKRDGEAKKDVNVEDEEDVTMVAIDKDGNKGNIASNEVIVEGKREDEESNEEKGGKINDAEKTSVVYSDNLTAFVSSLPFGVTKKDLEEFFSSCGSLKDVRMIFDRKTNKFKGIAYVEFGDETSLNHALDKNKSRIHGRPISILKSDPQKGFQIRKQQRSQKNPSEETHESHQLRDSSKTGKFKQKGETMEVIKGNKGLGEGIAGKEEEKRKTTLPTFAKPRAISRPIQQLGNKSLLTGKKKGPAEDAPPTASSSEKRDNEQPPLLNSNQAFREMFFKKESGK